MLITIGVVKEFDDDTLPQLNYQSALRELGQRVESPGKPKKYFTDVDYFMLLFQHFEPSREGHVSFNVTDSKNQGWQKLHYLQANTQVVWALLRSGHHKVLDYYLNHLSELFFCYCPCIPKV